MSDWLNGVKFSTMQKSLDALWLRYKATSDNLANIDTPGYKSKYVEFESVLSKALASGGTEAEISGNVGKVEPELLTNNAYSERLDGNNVNVDTENIELARTQLQYEYVIRQFSEELSRIRYVINEGRR